MMKRRTEAPLVVGLCLVSMLAFSSGLLFQQGKGHALWPAVTGDLRSLAHSGLAWFQGLQAAKTPAAQSSSTKRVVHKGSTVPAVSRDVGSPAVAVPADTSGAGQWSQADIQRMAGIVNEFTSSMTQADWTHAANAIAMEKPKDAQATLATLLATHLAPSDLSWLTQKFHGATAFGLEDVVLLQQTLSEAEAELTPQELGLVKQGISSYMASQNTTATGG